MGQIHCNQRNLTNSMGEIQYERGNGTAEIWDMQGDQSN